MRRGAGGGAALFAKKCDLINDDIFVEFRRIESAESSDFKRTMDCHDLISSSLAMTRIERHFCNFAESRNDNIMAFCVSIYFHESQSDSRNGDIEATPYNLTTSFFHLPKAVIDFVAFA